MKDQTEQIIALAKEHGVIRTRDIAQHGFNRNHLIKMVDNGVLLRAARGVYTLADFDVTESHSLVEATQIQSNGVVCLLSALSFHNIGTQLPHQIWLAVPYGSWISNRQTVPVRHITMRPNIHQLGIETHDLEGVPVPIYSIAKTVADCFKFRNKVGLDVALEALKEVLRSKLCTRDEIFTFAKQLRVDVIMRRYFEALSE